MPTPQKAVVIDELTQALGEASLAIVTDYRGLKVSDLQGFRNALRPFGADCRIAKNTLTGIAAGRNGIEGLEPHLHGPMAIVLVTGDIVGASKVVGDFVRTSKILTVKAGILNNQVISAAEVEAIATLPSREVLLAKLLGLLQSPMARTVGVLSGPSRSVAYVLQGRADQLAAD